MGYEQQIVCDQCGKREEAVAPFVPTGWVTLSGATLATSITSAIFCSVDCVVKWIEEKEAR